MKIALISLFSSIQTTGLRTISAVLKSRGHDVKLIFMKKKSTDSYTEKEIDDLLDLIKGSELVGLSLMTNYFDNAIQVTQNVKDRLKVPVIWGGIHATVRTEECLDHADMAAIGYADESIVELVDKIGKGLDYFDVKGIWFNRNGDIIKNDLRNYPVDLDNIPFQDYDWKTHYILSNKGIQLFTEELMDFLLNGVYMTHPTRGCPFACTYCCNNALIKLFPEEKPHFKKRTIANVIKELKWVKENLSFIKEIYFNDDAFLLYTEKEIEDFCNRYKSEISIPLTIGGTTPTSLTRTKLKMLVEAGLIGIRPGIQSESTVIKKIYKRNYSTERTLKAVNLIHEFVEFIPLPRYDIILNNPWETDDDLVETLFFLCKIPVPYELNIFSLCFYPGTELYDRAKAEGIIKDDLNDVYRVSYNMRADGFKGRFFNETYFNNLFYLVYVFALNGKKISESSMKKLTNLKGNIILRKMFYFMMRLKCRWILIKSYAKYTLEVSKNKNSSKRHLFENEFLD